MSIWAIKQAHQKLLADERGTVVKDPGGRLSVALLYPNTYRVGLANLGMQTVYRLLNERTDALCERAFLPEPRLAALYAKAGAPLLSLESSRPVAQFDLVLVSVSFENDYPNLASMLELAGLGLAAADRRGPLVVAGGVAAMLNPEPLAGLCDAFLLGEAEAVLEPFLAAFGEERDLPRPELLAALAARVRGFYAPALYTPAHGPDGALASFTPAAGAPARVGAPKHTGGGLAVGCLTAPTPELGDLDLLEVGRGCGHGCRFCAAGHVYRPPRLGQGPEFLAPALAAARAGGKVGLVSAAVSDLPGAAELAGQVVAAGGRVSVSSVRADRLTPELVAALAASRHQTVALAPEAGSARLRRVINKHLDEDHLFRAVEMLIAGGVPNLRLYFMTGLPGESDDDTAGIVRLTKAIRQQMVSAARVKGHLGRVTVSLNAFVPKPWTPFQWEAMAPLAEIKRRMNLVKKGLAGAANVKVVTDVPKYALLQGVLARGDRRCGALVTALAQGLPAERAYAAAGVDPAWHAQRARPRDELLPWDFIDHGVSRAYLWAEAQRAAEAKQSPVCQPATCRRCGACDGEEHDR